MTEDRSKLGQYIKATDRRVDNWSSAQKEAFQQATMAITMKDMGAIACPQCNGRKVIYVEPNARFYPNGCQPCPTCQKHI